MDDTGFRTDFGGATTLPSPNDPARRPDSAYGRAGGRLSAALDHVGVWGGAVVFALAAHIGFFAATALSRVQTRIAERPTTVVALLDLTPPPAPRRSEPAAAAQSQDSSPAGSAARRRPSRRARARP